MADKQLHVIAVRHEPLPAQTSRASQNFALKVPSGYTQYRFAVDSPEKATIRMRLAVDIALWTDPAIADGVRDGSVLAGSSWDPVYFAQVSGATKPFRVAVMATTPGPQPATMEQELPVDLTLRVDGIGAYYAARFPEWPLQKKTELLGLFNPQLYPIALVKPGLGHPSSPPADGVVLLPTQGRTSPADVKALFKNETPALPVDVVGLPVLPVDVSLVRGITLIAKIRVHH